MINKFPLSLALSVLSWIFLFLACSAQIAPINVDGNGVTLKGYDPVAYFTEKAPIKGKKEFQYEWRGATWLFASREHLDMFRENPKKYAPQYGGY